MSVIELPRTGYQKIIREVRSIDASSSELKMRTTLQSILMIAVEENKKEKELSNSDQTEDSSK
jgi:hypothetical protein